MKRSEVVEQIKYFLQCARDCENEEQLIYEAEDLMKYLEHNVKMLPPSSHRILTDIYGKKVGESFNCQWEPENENNT